MDPSLYHYSFHCSLLPPRRDVIGIHKMKNLIKNGLMTSMERHYKFFNKLPNNLLFIRSGVSIGQIPFIQTKEIGGINRAVYDIVRDKSLQRKFGDALKTKRSWQPNIFYVMIQKNISETVYEFRSIGNNKKEYFNPAKPIIVQKDITSQTIWDSILFIGGGTRAQKKWPPSKLSIIKWPENVNKNEYRNLVQYLHSLHYAFGPALPFPMGPTSLPSPLLYAQHYGQWFNEMILNNDIDETTLKVHQQLLKRPQITFI